MSKNPASGNRGHYGGKGDERSEEEHNCTEAKMSLKWPTDVY